MCLPTIKAENTNREYQFTANRGQNYAEYGIELNEKPKSICLKLRYIVVTDKEKAGAVIWGFGICFKINAG